MKLKNIALTSSLLAILTSCASYSASPLCNPSPDFVLASTKKDDLVVVAKAFNHKDCDQFLDRDVLSEGYQPIQLYIENNSDQRYIFSTYRITLPLASTEEVAESVHTSTVGRAVGYGVGALFLWPLAIPAIVDGMGSYEANKSLDRDFRAKAAHDQLIAPRSHLNTLLFVRSNGANSEFEITLVNEKTAEPKTLQVTILS